MRRGERIAHPFKWICNAYAPRPKPATWNVSSPDAL